MNEITFELVGKGYEKLDSVLKIYEEAFPENEREVCIEDFLELEELSDSIGIVAAIEADEVIGIVILTEKEEYAFLNFFATNDKNRGRGYGTKIMNALLDYYSDRVVLFEIESPVEGVANYEQRVKRKAFYERLGCVETGLVIEFEEERYELFCSEMNDRIPSYFKDYYMTVLEGWQEFDKDNSLVNKKRFEKLFEQLETQ